MFHARILFAVATIAILHGRVVDSTGAVLPGVTVEAAPTQGGKTTVGVTAVDGTYALDVEPGLYDLSFHLINFATTVRRSVAAASAPVTVDTTLHLSSSASVVVTARQTFRNLADLNEPVNDLIGIADSASVGVVTAQEIEKRPFSRAGEIIETVPGVVVSQHSGEGKANQYYLRGFNLDHGTDIAITVAGVPVNMPTHAHGQGYADANFLIPELIGAIQYKKGPYFADEGDFASAGAVNVNYLNVLDRPIGSADGGSFGYRRALLAGSPKAGNGFVLYAIEAARNDGPWVRPDGFRKLNGVLRYTRGDQRGGLSVTAMGYDAKWSSTDQIPERAVGAGSISRFGLIDPSDGGNTHRYSLSSEWQRNGSTWLSQFAAYAIDYRLDLFSNFTYFLDDPINGDQFEQNDRRRVYGLRGSHRWLATVGGVSAENVVGLQARVDDIASVGLFHTRERQRLNTISEDSIGQTGIGLYAQSSLQWTPRVRTVIGLRGDSYGGASLASPKLSLILGPWRKSEIYADAGFGFHSNDARGIAIGVDPLVRSKGAEIGARIHPAANVHVTAALWALDIDSELLFVGDAGTTEPNRPSRRTGLELTAVHNVRDWLALDSQLAYSRGRFSDFDVAGNRIPGAVEGVASLGMSLTRGRFSGELRDRYFGPRPLIEDDSVRSKASNTINARLGFAVTPRVRLAVDVFNALDAKVSDIDYFYASRLPGEPAAGVDDVHFHPIEKRAVRFSVRTTF